MKGQNRFRLYALAGLLATALSISAAVALAGAASAADTITTTTTDTTTTGDTTVGTVAVDQACYVNTATAAAKITISGAGWTPGDTITISDSRQLVSATATAGSSGSFSVSVPAPVVDSATAAEISDKLEAYDEGAPTAATTATSPTAYSAPFLTTNFAVIQSGNESVASRKTIFRFSGFSAGHTVYGHYLSAAGKLLATASFGAPAGACGLRRVETFAYPGGHGRARAYTVQFDNSRGYSKRTAPSFRLLVKL